jgi:hypothetical protein
VQFISKAQRRNRATAISAIGGGFSGLLILAALIFLVWFRKRKSKSIHPDDTEAPMEDDVPSTITEERDVVSEYGLSDPFELIDSSADASDIPRATFGHEYNPNELDDKSLGQPDLDIDEDS